MNDLVQLEEIGFIIIIIIFVITMYALLALMHPNFIIKILKINKYYLIFKTGNNRVVKISLEESNPRTLTKIERDNFWDLQLIINL